jgi:hypothetical protein
MTNSVNWNHVRHFFAVSLLSVVVSSFRKYSLCKPYSHKNPDMTQKRLIWNDKRKRYFPPNGVLLTCVKHELSRKKSAPRMWNTCNRTMLKLARHLMPFMASKFQYFSKVTTDELDCIINDELESSCFRFGLVVLLSLGIIVSTFTKTDQHSRRTQRIQIVTCLSLPKANSPCKGLSARSDDLPDDLHKFNVSTKTMSTNQL